MEGDNEAPVTGETLLPCPFCGGPGRVLMGGLVGCEPCALARRDAASWNRRSATGATVEQSSMVQTAVDTSAEAIERLVAFAMQGARYFESRPTGGEDAAHWSNVTNAETMRRIAFAIAALAAERDAAVARAAGWKEAFDRSSRLRAGDASERSHLVAEMTARGLLPVLQEIDREWLAQTAAHAETHGEARGMPADAVGRLVEVARAARRFIADTRDGNAFGVASFHKMDDALDALDALHAGILDQEPSEHSGR